MTDYTSENKAARLDDIFAAIYKKDSTQYDTGGDKEAHGQKRIDALAKSHEDIITVKVDGVPVLVTFEDMTEAQKKTVAIAAFKRWLKDHVDAYNFWYGHKDVVVEEEEPDEEE